MRRKHSRHDTFCREYMKDLNGTRAAIAAGYSKKTAGVTASQLLNNPKVKAKLGELMEKHAIKLDLSAEQVLSELALMGFANFCDYIRTTEEGDAYIELSQLTRDQAAAIQSITVDEYVEGRGKNARPVKRTRIKLADKTRSLELLGRYLNLFNLSVNVNVDLAERVKQLDAARRREREALAPKELTVSPKPLMLAEPTKS
jgi:phage terminase small subunit